MFQNDYRNLSDKYSISITPAEWTLYIWIVIYVWQVLWVAYSVTLLFRRNRLNTGLLYYSPPFLPPVFFVIYMMNLILNVTWLFTWDSEFIAASFVAVAGSAFALAICEFFMLKLLWDYEAELGKSEMIANIIIVQNGIGAYSSYVLFDSIWSFSVMLHYNANVSMDTSCYIGLVIILATFLIFYFLDVLLATKRARYYFMPYIIIMLIFAGIVDKNWDSSSGVQIFAAVTLALFILSIVGKVMSVIYYRIREPLSIEK